MAQDQGQFIHLLMLVAPSLGGGLLMTAAVFGYFRWADWRARRRRQRGLRAPSRAR